VAPARGPPTDWGELVQVSLVHIIAYYVVLSHMPRAVHGMPMALLVLSMLCAGYYFLFERSFVRWSKEDPTVKCVGGHPWVASKGLKSWQIIPA